MQLSLGGVSSQDEVGKTLNQLGEAPERSPKDEEVEESDVRLT